MLLSGFFLSIAAAGDCAFVNTEVPVPVFTATTSSSGGNNDVAPAIRLANKLGFFMYTNIDTGQCYYWSDNTFATIEDQITFYINNVLGSDWYQSINLAWSATSVSLLFFLYAISYCCSSQVRPVRYVLGIFIGIVVVVFQGLCFLVYGSEWCDRYQCTFGRSAGFAVGAATCFLLSGIMWCLTTDYPGEDSIGIASDGAVRQQYQQQQYNSDDMETGDMPELQVVDIDNNTELAFAVIGTEGGAGGGGQQSPNAWQTY